MPYRLRVAALVLILSACALPSEQPDGTAAAETTAPADQELALVDPNIPPAVAGKDGWNYHRSAEIDLNGDGQLERVVLTARVELYRGRPAWDDGQPWQVYIEAADGRRTYLYAQRLQLGTLTMRISRSEPGEPASIILLEHLPDRLSLYEAFYEKPGHAITRLRFERALDPRGDLASPQLP